ncbi:hypothetical protein TrRE_jg3305, partial [Triparma retinervis]
MSYNHYGSQDVRSGGGGGNGNGGGYGGRNTSSSSNRSSLSRAVNSNSGQGNSRGGWGNSNSNGNSSNSSQKYNNYGNSSGNSKNRGQPKGGGPKIRGQTMAFWEECFVCAVCRTNISGPDSLVQHCMGKAHMKKNRGRRGYAGVVANAAGITPDVSQALIDRCSTGMGTTSSIQGGGGGKGGGGMVNQEKLGVVGLSAQSSAMVLDALRKNKSEK